jgi:hypothetical protein
VTGEDQHGTTLLSAIASLVSAVAWPLLIAVLVFCYRKTIRETLPVLIGKLRSATTVELAGLKLTQAEHEIERAVQGVTPEMATDKVPESQVMGAKELDKRLAVAGVSVSETVSVIEPQVVQLAQLYESIRSAMPRGEARTQAMDEVVAKMRTLGIRMLPFIDRMALSRSSGERLSAIAALQVKPDLKYSRWLVERIYVEVPFLFFHASLALNEYARSANLWEPLRTDIQKALEHILKFPEPDMNTVRILRQILDN